AALKELAEVYDDASGEIFAEEKYAQQMEETPTLQMLRLRPFLGYRSACASLYRTVRDHILPQQADSPVVVQKQSREGEQRLRSDAMDAEGKEAPLAASKARALFVALRQLTNSDPWSLERSAKSKDEDWAARTPKLETPKYEVVSRDALSGFEVREYAPYAVVQTRQGAEVANNRSFFMLADYIFGKKNVRNEKMAMTTPVQMDRDSGAMSFIMPSKYWTSLETAPAPAENSGVLLQERPVETLAVSCFGGYALQATVAKKTEELIDFVEKSETWEIVENTTRLMQYNDPFTVPWKRRNEVSIPVRAKAR
ncbi:Heme-binding-like protein At3g10130, partial [Durusdinium trenchii]